jgi:hypothetical protein
MGNNDDEKAFVLIEKAVYRAKDILAVSKSFQPFLLLLNEAGEEEFYSNDEPDEDKSYAQLEEKLEERILQGGIDILLLVSKSGIPAKFSSSASHSIRVHLEEKSQIGVKVGARFLYVPYERIINPNESISVLLDTPLPVGFIAQYIL